LKLLACDTDACGGIPFTEAIDALPIPQMWVDGFQLSLLCRAQGGGGANLCERCRQRNNKIYAQLIVAELGAIESKMVDAAAMAGASAGASHIALYSIYFDTGKAVIKPESRPTLEQIAKLLAGQRSSTSSSSATPTAGHLRLQSRSVAPAPRRVTELVKNYRIATAAAHRGVGLLAPIGSTPPKPTARSTAASGWWRRKTGSVRRGWVR
jgi:hypothetical protein